MSYIFFYYLNNKLFVELYFDSTILLFYIFIIIFVIFVIYVKNTFLHKRLFLVYYKFSMFILSNHLKRNFIDLFVNLSHYKKSKLDKIIKNSSQMVYLTKYFFKRHRKRIEFFRI